MTYKMRQSDWRQLAFDVARSAGGELVSYMHDGASTIIIDANVHDELAVYVLDYPDIKAWLETQLAPVLTERHKPYS